ncbi:MAG: hypothetical protein H6813_03110 [Phycisphaeraceae bacterium]|nr:hypothetical protein [Phycisphaeraceae bacterium]MCB9846934.1 hypothetical protein [Phycisphaeraceae bacterium]
MALPMALLCWSPMTGCESSRVGATSVRIEPGSYDVAFRAVKDELRAQGFELDRIDARAGIITTLPHTSAGLATPWIGDESTIEQEFEGLLNRQQRMVRVVFTPIDDATGGESGAPDANDRAWRARVEATVERIHRVGFRPSPASVRLSSVAGYGLQDNGDDDAAWTTTPIGRDERYEARIVERLIHRTMERRPKK